ncbi:helix-turn-helix domain-containing protein [Ligilactobacillus murinus]|uniref:helix-turn-helix domain-containing protein n=1 Tax=Ligilactobacillus murinus TaxID=1622 RepID=UPI001C8CE12E|nr:helix-turn-helix domain-containing protein [Ligilactobacillus murinus]MBX9012635.1 helix-turn-helix domain-containing protein [Ligilactobacillus murinus]
MAEQEFTGVRLFLNIPAEVAHDPRFKSDKSILLFGEIFSMLNVTGSFFMSNKEMAKRIRAKSEKTVQNCLSELEKLGYIKREIITDKKSGKVVGRGRITSPYCNRFMGGVTDYVPPCNEIHPGGVTDYAIKEHNNKSSNNNVQKQLEEDFEKLWKLYPKKSGKPKAFSAYKRAIKKGVTNKEIQTGIVNYLTQIKVQRTNKQYIKQGSTWFNGECWNDEYNVGGSSSPVNPKTVPSSAPADRTVADLEREQRESRRDAFPMQYKNHPEWFSEETIKSILEEFPELREVVAEIDRARATSDRNTA